MGDPMTSGDALRTAMSRHQAGDLGAARRLYAAHLESSPDDVEALCLLAALEGQTGDHEAAGDAFAKVIERQPDHAPAHAGLGTSRLLRGDLEGAISALGRALELDPDNLDVRLHQVAAMRRAGQLDGAIEGLQEILRRHPDHLQSRFNLGVAMMESGRPREAAECYQAVIDKDPRRAQCHAGLGQALLSMNRIGEARRALEKALALSPGNPMTEATLGRLLAGCGETGEARAAYERALEKAPGLPAALTGLAEIERATGNPRRGMERLRPYVESDDPPGQMLILMGRLLLAAEEPAGAADFATRRLAQTGLLPGVRGALLRIRGCANDRLGRHDDAWNDWTEGRREEATRFDPADFERVIDVLVETFGAGTINRIPAAQDWDGPKPVLVIGAPRSGKSILEQMLAGHPEVHGAGELRVLGNLTNEISSRLGSPRPYPMCAKEMGQEQVERLASEYREAIGSYAPKARWIVDTQPTNFLHVGLAALLCPGIRVIRCRRDPIDLAWACCQREFVDPAIAFVSTPAALGHYIAGMDRLVAHWSKLAGVEIMTVDYEDLVRDPEPVLRETVEFLGLAWDEGCMRHDQLGQATLSVAPAISGPVTDAEIGRGGPYRDRFAVLETVTGTQRDD